MCHRLNTPILQGHSLTIYNNNAKGKKQKKNRSKDGCSSQSRASASASLLSLIQKPCSSKVIKTEDPEAGMMSELKNPSMWCYVVLYLNCTVILQKPTCRILLNICKGLHNKCSMSSSSILVMQIVMFTRRRRIMPLIVTLLRYRRRCGPDCSAAAPRRKSRGRRKPGCWCGPIKRMDGK